MPENPLSRAAILMVLLVVVVIGSWEIYLRYTGVAISYDNGKELWADKRAMVYAPADKATVFIGSSRIKYDLDIDTWRKVTGRNAVQLAVEGTSPVPTLVDLGNDPQFKGKLVVDVTEGLFFSPMPGAGNGKDQRENIAYYKSRTPAQRASFVLNHALESGFVFLDKDFLSLNGELDKLTIPNRPGVFSFPIFPKEFQDCNFDRQNKMADKFLTDTALQHQVQNIWVFVMTMGKMAPHDGPDPVPGILQTVKTAVDKIRARGGEVVFIRTPSSGAMWQGEQHAFPRAKLWEPLLATTHSTGLFFTDHPATDHFVCPEWSHLKPSDAVLYTQALIGELPKSFVE
jgi:hypothetical protein